MERVEMKTVMNCRYLSLKRKREARKDFNDWGNKSITAEEGMPPLVYDEITSVAHTEFRIAKEYG